MQTAIQTADVGNPNRGGDLLYLSFDLGGQNYGIPVTDIQEIHRWTPVTPLPHCPAHFKGVFNLRGTIVPVVDLRARFGLPSAEYGKFTVTVVVNLDGRLAGMVVDAVNDVVQISAAHRCTMPELEGPVDRRFITGLAQLDDKLVILLSAGKLVSPEELAVIESVGS